MPTHPFEHTRTESMASPVPLTDGGPTLADLLADELDRMRTNRWATYSWEALAWVAALPEITVALAESIGLPPAPYPTPAGLLEALASDGLLDSTEIIDGEGHLTQTYWMSQAIRTEAGDHLLAEHDSSQLQGAIDELVSRLDKATVPDVQPLDPWRTVARSYLMDPSGLGLLRQTDALLVAGQGSAALALVAAARSLGSLVGEPLASAARRAQWRVDRAFRQALDLRVLDTYLPRDDVEGRIAAFIRDPRFWALHIVGDGGLGKTMVIRYLASGRLATRWRLPELAVARVDFDHLDPRYPERRPAELLLALAQELEVYTDSRRAERLASIFADSARAVHERLSSRPRDVRQAGFQGAVEVFADYLSSLRRPVVLVIDTCEELAKLHAPNTASPAIESTFEILQVIHRLAPSTRAILAGRRWLVPRPSLPAAPFGMPRLPTRSFLDVFEIGGFDRTQAQRYIDLRDPAATVPEALRRAVLERAARGRNGESVPFDLACYVEWALAEPTVDPALVRDAPGDPYIEQRILGRIADADVREAIPVAVELGRFDEQTLTVALTGTGMDAARVFSGLAGQEWVSTTAFTTEGQPQTVQVDDHLSARIRAVARADPARFRVDRTAVGRQLAQWAHQRVPDELSVELIETTVRLLPIDEAGKFWEQLERQVVDHDGWAWASQVTPRVAAAEADRAGAGSSILAAILATQACTVTRLHGAGDALDLWGEVASQAHRHPNPDTGRRLAGRSAAGQVAAGDQRAQRLLAERSEPDLAFLADAILAAANATVSSSVPWPDRSVVLSRVLQATPEPLLQAGILLARSADHTIGTRLVQAAEDARRALDLLEATDQTQAPEYPSWWPAPRLVDRARCAVVQLARHLGKHPDDQQYGQWLRASTANLDDPDTRALVSAILDHHLDWRTWDAPLPAMPTYEQEPPVPDFWLQRARPLFSVLADVAVAVGDLARAADELTRRRDVAARSDGSATTLAACDAALVRVSREARTQVTTAVRDSVRSLDPAVRAEAWIVLALVEGRSPDDPNDAGGPHAWWRAQVSAAAADIPWAESILAMQAQPHHDFRTITSMSAGPAPANYPTGPGPVSYPMGAGPVSYAAGSDPALIADQAEIQLLRSPDARIPILPFAAFTPITPALVVDNPDAAGGLLRAAALQGRDLVSVTQHLPPRMTAVLALREAELTALRAPAITRPLFHLALWSFARVADRFGWLRAATLTVLAIQREGRADPSVSPALADLVNDAPWWLADSWSAPELAGWQQRVALAVSIRVSGSSFDVDDPAPELAVGHASGRRTGLRWFARPDPDEATDTAPESARRLQQSITLRLQRGEASWAGCEIFGTDTELTTRLRRSRRSGWEPWHAQRAPDLPRLQSSTRYLVVPLALPPTSYGDSQELERSVCDAIMPNGFDPLMVRFLDNATTSAKTPDVPTTLTWSNWPPAATRLPSVYEGPAHLRPTSLRTQARPGREVFIRHLVGTPVPTSSGWGMRVTTVPPSSHPTSVSPTAPPASRSSSRPSPRSSAPPSGSAAAPPPGLFLIDDLVRISTELLVLQMDPVDTPPEPLGKLRGGMTAVCLDLMASGAVGAVLAIPALPDQLAGAVSGWLWSLVPGPATLDMPSRPEALLELTYRIRAAVAGASPVAGPGEQPWLDVMLYLRNGTPTHPSPRSPSPPSSSAR